MIDVKFDKNNVHIQLLINLSDFILISHTPKVNIQELKGNIKNKKFMK